VPKWNRLPWLAVLDIDYDFEQVFAVGGEFDSPVSRSITQVMDQAS